MEQINSSEIINNYIKDNIEKIIKKSEWNYNKYLYPVKDKRDYVICLSCECKVKRYAKTAHKKSKKHIKNHTEIMKKFLS